jgi:hypothetical protein
MDFCKKNTANFFNIKGYEPIDSRMMGHLYSGSEWAIPDQDDLGRMMNNIFNSKDAHYFKEKTKRARRFILNNFTWDKCSERILKAIDKDSTDSC